MKKFVAIAGNIGVGKSTLVDKLCKKMNFTPFYEPVTENPYLTDFYKDMQTWAFHSQVSFLTHRLRSHHALSHHGNSVIQDRSVYEDAEIFAHNLYLQGHLHPRDYKTYRELYQTMVDFLPPPDLVIYLRASVPTLMNRISMRGRDYERSIPSDYLSSLNVLYENWIADFTICPVLTVPADDLDYVVYNGHLNLITEKVTQKLTGNDEVIFLPSEVQMAAVA
jgi:deoxyadenosine/deoxycytidine kinase